MSRQHSIVFATRRACLAGIALLALAPLSMTAYAAPATLQVWKDPNCGCCKDWIAHLEKNGFATTVIDQGNNAARARLGMPQKFGSCHTALIQGYVIEGHVPAADIQPYSKKNPKPWDCQCQACRLGRQAWTVHPMTTDAMRIRCC